MNRIKFTKYCGAGNDFVFFDAVQTPLDEAFKAGFPNISNSEISKRLCDRHFGIGADGVVILRKDAKGGIFWEFYNSDGSEAEMCGNAARCAALFAKNEGITVDNAIVFGTQAGQVQAQIMDTEWVRVSMPKYQWLSRQLGFKSSLGEFVGDVVNTGVPHLVFEYQNFGETQKMAELARKLRFHPSLGKKGANITFYRPLKEFSIEAVSFERGVENFTLACGTGAVAAALSYVGETSESKSCEVRVPGGNLEIEFGNIPGQVYLIGPAVHVFSGVLP